MRKLFIAFTLLFSAVAAFAQSSTTLSASDITDGFSRPLASAKLCFSPVDAMGTATGFRVGAIQVVTTPVCGTVSNGVLQSGLVVVPNPTGTYYHITVNNRTTNAILRDYGMTQITGSSWTLDSYDPSMAVLPVTAITMGTVTTLSPGTGASCTLSGSGPTLLNCGIPKGDAGAAGATGPTGPAGGVTTVNGATGAFVVTGGGASCSTVSGTTTCTISSSGGGLSLTPSARQTVSYSAATNVLSTDDPTLGQTHQSNLTGALQPQNYYSLNSTRNGLANMLAGTGNNPSQVRIIMNGDSTAQFHNQLIACQMTAKFGIDGYDFGGGLEGTNVAYGQPCGASGQTLNSSSGTLTLNNGTSVPYDYTRSPEGVIVNLASGASATYGSGGSYATGNNFKVYYVKQPSDGISHATPGTLTVTETTPSTGTCPSGCTLATINTNNGSSLGAVMYIHKATAEPATLTLAASGGAVDYYAVGIYDTTQNGVIVSSGTGRGGLALPDSVSTPTAITQPWYASATGAPPVINSWSCTGTACTFVTTAQNLIAGEKVVLGGFLTSTYFNSINVTVSATGLSSTGFQGTVSSGVTGSATESGYALEPDSNALVMFEMKDNGGGTYPACTQATTAVPGTLQTVGFWMAMYASQWKTTANPLDDIEITGSYDINSTCVPVINEAYRELAQANRYVYYDNYFNESWTAMENRGQLSNSVHSAPNEQISHAQDLWRQLGFDSFIGGEQRDVGNVNTQTKNFWLGTSDPRSSVQGLCNPASASCVLPSFHQYAATNGTGLTYGDISKQWSLWDGPHSNCFFNVYVAGGGQISPCMVNIAQFGTTGSVGTLTGNGPNGMGWSFGAGTGGGSFNVWNTTNSSAGPATIGLSEGNSAAVAGVYMGIGSTLYWRASMFQTTGYSVRDDIGGKIILLFPSNTMPANSIGGNSNGAMFLTLNTNTNCSSSASPAVCGSAASGSLAVAAAATTVVVNTSAVTANSQIHLQFDASLGTKLGVTCNTTYAAPWVSARTAATSFTVTVGAAPTTNPACYSYTIIN